MIKCIGTGTFCKRQAGSLLMLTNGSCAGWNENERLVMRQQGGLRTLNATCRSSTLATVFGTILRNHISSISKQVE